MDRTETKAAQHIGQVERAARWNELGIEQKVERLREAMLSQAAQLEHTGTQATQAAVISKEHRHGSDGEVLMPVLDSRGVAGRIHRLLG